MTQPGCIFRLIKCTYVLGQFRLIADRTALEGGGRGSPSAPRSEGSGSLWRKPGGAARVRGRLGPRSADLCRRDLPDFTATQLNRDANICRVGVSSGTLLAEQRSNLFSPGLYHLCTLLRPRGAVPTQGCCRLRQPCRFLPPVAALRLSAPREMPPAAAPRRRPSPGERLGRGAGWRAPDVSLASRRERSVSEVG